MNRFEHYRVSLDDVPLHFVNVRGKGPNPMPLVLTHRCFAKVIGPLTDPVAHGGDAVDSFDAIVPSLPGFVFSSPHRRPDIGRVETAALWLRLMRDVLGYERFGAQGGDWGAFVTAQLVPYVSATTATEPRFSVTNIRLRTIRRPPRVGVA